MLFFFLDFLQSKNYLLSFWFLLLLLFAILAWGRAGCRLFGCVVLYPPMFPTDVRDGNGDDADVV